MNISIFPSRLLFLVNSFLLHLSFFHFPFQPRRYVVRHMINDKPLLPSTVSSSKAVDEDDKTVRLSSPPSILDFGGGWLYRMHLFKDEFFEKKDASCLF